jgi:hypothetical protein
LRSLPPKVFSFANPEASEDDEVPRKHSKASLRREMDVDNNKYKQDTRVEDEESDTKSDSRLDSSGDSKANGHGNKDRNEDGENGSKSESSLCDEDDARKDSKLAAQIDIEVRTGYFAILDIIMSQRLENACAKRKQRPSLV